MKIIKFLIYLSFLFSCQSGKINYIDGIVVHTKGVLCVITDSQKDYFFVNCIQIIDTINILNNINNRNIDTSLILNNNIPTLRFVLDNQEDMIQYVLDDGMKLDAILVDLTYSETNFFPKNFPNRIFESNFNFNDTTINIFFFNDVFKIHNIQKYNPD